MTDSTETCCARPGLGAQTWEVDVCRNHNILPHSRGRPGYTYAIITTIDLTLDTYEDKLSPWAQIYGHGIKNSHPYGNVCRDSKKNGVG